LIINHQTGFRFAKALQCLAPGILKNSVKARHDRLWHSVRLFIVPALLDVIGFEILREICSAVTASQFASACSLD